MKSEAQNGQPDITLHDVMTHQQMIARTMREGFANIEKRLLILETDMKEVKSDIYTMNRKLLLVETKIDNIDERLDDIEIIPSIVKHLRTKK